MKISDLEEFKDMLTVKTKEEIIAQEIAEDLKLTEQEINGFDTLLEQLRPFLEDDDLQSDIDLILNSDPELKQEIENELKSILEKRNNK